MKVETNNSTAQLMPAKIISSRGRSAVWQARLVLLVMINLAQLWILSAAVDAALGREFRHLFPLVVASGICWAISLSIYFWWRPVGARRSGSA
jgi:hypothetical protein